MYLSTKFIIEILSVFVSTAEKLIYFASSKFKYLISIVLGLAFFQVINILQTEVVVFWVIFVILIISCLCLNYCPYFFVYSGHISGFAGQGGG